MTNKNGPRIQRPAVHAFAHLMEMQLRANDHKGGWDDVDPLWLCDRLEEKVSELKAELYLDGCDQMKDQVFTFRGIILCDECYRKTQRRVAAAMEFATFCDDEEWEAFEAWRKENLGY